MVGGGGGGGEEAQGRGVLSMIFGGYVLLVPVPPKPDPDPGQHLAEF